MIYVREVALPGVSARVTSPDRVVLFVHGAGTPGEVAFDVPFEDYSWMAYLAKSGYDVFAMDMTGYGRSTRPLAMNDPCNFGPEAQKPFVKAPCPPSYPNNMTTLASDWNDISAVVDYLLERRQVPRVALIGWSLGGPRAGGYAARNQDKVSKLILLSPAYNRDGAAEAAEAVAAGPAMSAQTKEDFDANWSRQIGCPDQFVPAASKAVWAAMLDSDPQGMTWGPGIRRAPLVTSRGGWSKSVAAMVKTPTLLFAAAHDKQVLPAGVGRLHEDLGPAKKILVDLGCTSHNALWEKNHLVLFKASLEWLRKGTVEGKDSGKVRLGY